uniref:Uncharacterized protein n=1 Tax=Arundo donax TaxID=35708 RepID=A0A0A8Y4B8_ARUDO
MEHQISTMMLVLGTNKRGTQLIKGPTQST